jgi:hypothetical protein
VWLGGSVNKWQEGWTNGWKNGMRDRERMDMEEQLEGEMGRWKKVGRV